ncbi:hypothetical protein IWQ62_003302, partial [Dispira parvispora]
MEENLTSTSSKLCSWDDSDSYQERSTETTDDIRNREMEHTIERILQEDLSNLVSKVVGFEEIGEYKEIAGKVEEFITLSTKYASATDDDEDPDQQKRRLCKKVWSWLNWDQEGSKIITEHTMYLCVVNYLFLVGMVLAENEHEAQGTAIQRRIMPHPGCGVGCDSKASIRCDIALQCRDLNVDIQQEYESFKPDSNLSGDEYGPDKKQKGDDPKSAEGEGLDKFRDQVKNAFGFVKVKKSPKDD